MSLPEPVLLDSNVAMYAAGRDHPLRGPCQRVLTRAAAGQLQAVTDAEVHQEILHRYLALGEGTKARQVSEDLQVVVPDVLPITIEDISRARELSSSYPAMTARDLLHVAVMLNHGIRTIISADRDFDQVLEITRLDPLQVEQTSE